LTGYRVAKTGGVPRPKAYEQLQRLAKAGVVVQRKKGWVLLDKDLQTFFRKRLRISWLEDWSAERNRRAPEVEAMLDRLAKLPHIEPEKGWKPRPATLRQLNRDARKRPFKDAILARMGLRISIRAAVAWNFEAEETRKKGRVLKFRRIIKEGRPYLVIEKRKPKGPEDRGATADEWLDELYGIGWTGGPRGVPDRAPDRSMTVRLNRRKTSARRA
jgi:hypothetical protein